MILPTKIAPILMIIQKKEFPDLNSQNCEDICTAPLLNRNGGRSLPVFDAGRSGNLLVSLRCLTTMIGSFVVSAADAREADNLLPQAEA